MVATDPRAPHPGMPLTTAPPTPSSPARPPAPAIVEIEDVTKQFGATTVIDNVSLAVPAGQIYGLIGPSGCGKSTTVRMLVGVLAPTSGQVRVLGVEPRRFSTREREQIGYTPQGFYLYPTLTVQENARFVAGLYGLGLFKRGRRIREVLEFLELWEARKRLARDISGGMQRRLALACALLHRPRLLFVDEPTAGLDPVLREKIWDHLRALRDEGATVMVTTQYIDEAVWCDTVAIMNRGRLAATGAPEELRRQAMGGEIVEVEAEGMTRPVVAALWNVEQVSDVARTGPHALQLKVEDSAAAIPAITDALRLHEVNVLAVRPHIPTFDEVFMKIVSEQEARSV